MSTVTGRFNGSIAKAKAHKGANDGLKAMAEAILAEANKLVPLESGKLMASGTVTGSGNDVAISYDTPYAVRLHEHPEYKFKNGRQGKWLETAINAYGRQAIIELVSHISRELR